jgi:hypothetical protein
MRSVEAFRDLTETRFLVAVGALAGDAGYATDAAMAFPEGRLAGIEKGTARLTEAARVFPAIRGETNRSTIRRNRQALSPH